MRICRTATVPFFLQNHLRGQIIAMAAAGHEVTLVSSNGPEVSLLKAIPNIHFHIVEIPRKISPFRDLVALWRLFRLFQHERYDIVHSTTPKAGMLTAIAGYMARIPIRLHTFTGQPWVEMKGILHHVAKSGDRLTSSLNTHCYADSFSQRELLIAEHVAQPNQISVIGSGSLAGVDVERFDRNVWMAQKNAILEEIGVEAGSKVITFIGRLTKDKGIGELVRAFESLRGKGLKCSLLLVGPKEKDWELLPASVRCSIEDDPYIHCVGYTSQPERYLAASDIFCLPSYREGFGNVVIEAAAMGIATVGTNIVGLCEAVANNETGLLVPPKDHEALAAALRVLLVDDKLRVAMGDRARSRAVSEFDARKVNSAILVEYDRFFAQLRNI
jgi:glycosyltransferase involved in cell wall biosynthesis